jgi:transposase
LSRGDRNRNARLARLRELVPVSNAIVGIAARRGLELAEQTDLVLDHADALLMLADALDALDRADDAATARGEALTKLRAKRNLAAVARLTRLGSQRSPSS